MTERAMHVYDVVLFLHLAALFLAFGATGIMGLAMRRVRTAATGADALPWLGVAKQAAHAFPVAILSLVASGAYMVHHSWSWSAGFVDAGLAGVVWLALVGDRVEGARAKRLAQALAADPRAPIAGEAERLRRDPVWWTGAVVNPAVALGVAFDMATKPASHAAAFGVLAVAVAAGALLAVPLWRNPVERPAAEPLPSTE